MSRGRQRAQKKERTCNFFVDGVEKQTDIHSNVLHETLPDMIAEFDRRFDQNAEKS